MTSRTRTPDKPLTPTEEQDFRAQLQKLGHDPNEFEISYFRLAPEPGVGGGYRLYELVTVKRKYGRGEVTAKGGHGLAWVSDAVAAVKAGKFGPK